jgi:transketolase
VRVIDLYSVKPIDKATIQAAAKETGLLVVVEDHWPEGGLGDAVLGVFAAEDGSQKTEPAPRVVKMAVNGMPGSGTPDELLDAAGISVKKIVETVKAAVK